MAGKRIDWNRAKRSSYDEAPLSEISDRDAFDDQQVLARSAELEKKAREAAYRKLPRLLKDRQKLSNHEEAKSRPDRLDERRLRSILHCMTLKHFAFEASTYFPITDRAFVSQRLKVRIVIVPDARGTAALIRAKSRVNFDWVLIKLTTEGVMHEGSVMRTLIADVCASQSKLHPGS